MSNYYTLPTREPRFCLSSLFGVIDSAHPIAHNGTDFYGFTLAYPICDGMEVIKHVPADSERGNHVILKDPDGIIWYYQHFVTGSVTVTVGQILDINTPIGTLGRTGNSTGIHLHLGCRLSETGKDVNPNLFLTQLPNKLGCYNTADYLQGAELENQNDGGSSVSKKKIRIFSTLGVQPFEPLSEGDLKAILEGDRIYKKYDAYNMELFDAVVAKEVESLEHIQTVLNTLEQGQLAKVDKA